MRSIFVLALYCILCNLIGFAQTRYEFTCDAYSNGVNTYTDVPGKIIVDSDGNGMTLAIIVSHRVKKKVFRFLLDGGLTANLHHI